MHFKILSANETSANVRLMHPLVGRDIEYRVKVLAVRDPTGAAARPPSRAWSSSTLTSSTRAENAAPGIARYG